MGSEMCIRDRKNLLTVFLHAPMEYRVKRVMTDQSITNPTLAEKTIKKQDKARADYYNFFTHKKWGDAGSAMLSVDTSMLDTDGIAALIADAVTMVERTSKYQKRSPFGGLFSAIWGNFTGNLP